MSWDDELPKPKPAITVGENLERLSVADLDERVQELEAEIVRVKAERTAKKTLISAAEALFKG